MNTNTIRYWEFWSTLKAYLAANANLMRVLSGGKVYVEGQDYSKPEGPENQPWGRLVLVPTNRIWEDQVGTGPTREMSFLTRAEVNPITDVNFSAQKLLDGIQAHTTESLDGYVLPKLTHIMGALPLWVARPPQPLPLWDDDRAVYFTSAEWRCEVAAPGA